MRGGDTLELLYVGRAEARKGLPVLLRAFEALRSAGVRARLTVAGATEEEVRPLLLDPEGVRVAGRVTEEEKWRLLGAADLLCAPSLGGESFGMVLTEAFASTTPVVASDIAGYRDVVRDGTDGLLVPAADPAALGEALRDLALDPARREAHGRRGRPARRAVLVAARDRRGPGGLRRRRGGSRASSAAASALAPGWESRRPTGDRRPAPPGCRRSSPRSPARAGGPPCAWPARPPCSAPAPAPSA